MRTIGSRARFWIEAGLAAVAAGLAVLTLLMPDWIEAVFGIEPDEGNGTLEFAITGVAIAAAVTFALAARTEWRRHAALSGAGPAPRPR